MKSQFLIFACFFGIISAVNAQDFYLNFVGHPETNQIDTIFVKNLSNETSVSLSGTDILHLLPVVETKSWSNKNSKLNIYPNPTDESCFVEFEATTAGRTIIEVYDISGKVLLKKEYNLEQAVHKIEILGITSGVYNVIVKSDSYFYSGRLIGTGAANSGLNLNYVGSYNVPQKESITEKSRNAVEIAYNYGDILLFKTFSNLGYQTIKTLVLTEDDTIPGIDEIVVFFDFYNCEDIENNVYPIVTINDQIWMAENLKTTYFQDTTQMLLIDNNIDWESIKSSAYCNLDNDTAKASVYGNLYNWYAVSNTKKICPKGWHVPTDDEWKSMEQFLGMSEDDVNSRGWRGSYEGCLLKESGTDNWQTQTGDSINLSGFTGLPGGIRSFAGDFYYESRYATWWTISQSDSQNAWCRAIRFDNCDIFREDGSKVMGFSVRCIMDEIIDTVELLLPVLTTTSVTDVYMNDAVSGGNITDDGGAEITARGVVWSFNPNPTIQINDGSTVDGVGIGSFASNLSGLNQNTSYYVRAYATNSVGTAYGDELNFGTMAALYAVGSGLTDIEGRDYSTIILGTKEYMSENLRTSEYNDGTPILKITDNVAWSNVPDGAYCWYDNDSTSNEVKNGKLYNWKAVSTGKLCPTGWHVMLDGEWKEMEMFLGMTSEQADMIGWRGTDEGGKLKEYGTTNWNSPNLAATNISGFSSVPTGYRSNNGNFFNAGNVNYFWTYSQNTSVSSWSRHLNFDYSSVYRNDDNNQSGFSVRCTKGEIVIPTLTTTVASDITLISAISGGNITDNGWAIITDRGIVWSSDPNPTILANEGITSDGSGDGSFISNLSGLSQNRTYYVRAYATNIAGTAYGDEITFNTLAPLFSIGSGVTDIEGKAYSTIILGTREYMSENLRTALYNDGTPIVKITDDLAWTNTPNGAYCWYNNDSTANEETFGKLYNFNTIISGNLCPTGWHVMLDDEWKELEMNIGMTQEQADLISWRGNDEGGKLKLSGTTYWNEPNLGATNQSGFASLATGFRSIDGSFQDFGISNYLWTSSVNSDFTAWARQLKNDNKTINRTEENMNNGFSVRCVKSIIPTITTSAATNIDLTTATSGGIIIYNGFENLSSGGIVWSSTSNPNITNNDGITNDAIGTGEFVSNIVGLIPKTTYYVRAYATYSGVTYYGDQISFLSLATVQQRLNMGETPKEIVDSGISVDSIYGKTYQGGLIFYLDTDSGYGIVATSYDINSFAEYGCGGMLVNAVDTIIGTGMINTQKIVFNCSGGYNAAFDCDTLNLGGYDDWFLPAKDELNEMYVKKDYLPGFGTYTYWSSSEAYMSPDWTAWSLSPAGTWNLDSKKNYNYVRAARSFGPDPIKDFDGNEYKTVFIGTQVWMKENIRATHFQNGEAIPMLTSNFQWTSLPFGPIAYCQFDNNPDTAAVYGNLYNFHVAADSRNICPVGWHVPSDTEWTTLTDFIGGEYSTSEKLIEENYSHWDYWGGGGKNAEANSKNGIGNQNSTGFSAFGAGIRSEIDGTFVGFRMTTSFWTNTAEDASNAYIRNLSYDSLDVWRDWVSKNLGGSIRCLKD